MPSRSWGSYGFPMARRHETAASLEAKEGMSDPDMELRHVKRPMFLSQRRPRSRSSSPGGGSSPSTPGSWESSPRASTSSSGESHWSLSSPKAFSFSKHFGSRFSRRFGRSKHEQSDDREAEQSEPSSPTCARMLPMLLDELPADAEESENYMTVIVGERSINMKTYVINKHLLTHHLVQTLMKCSEDMAGPPEFRRNDIFPVVCCDPALFVSVVQAVGNDLTANLH